MECSFTKKVSINNFINKLTNTLWMDLIRKIPKKLTKKFGNKVIIRQYFRRKTGLELRLRHYGKATNFEKISHLFWQLLSNVKTSGILFWPFQKTWSFIQWLQFFSHCYNSRCKCSGGEIKHLYFLLHCFSIGN